MKLITYADGSCLGNPGPGGWAYKHIFGNKEHLVSGGTSDKVTNNQMEMRAVIEALKSLKRPTKIEFKLDSNYVGKGMTEWVPNWKANGWKKKDRKAIANLDMWKEIDSLIINGGHTITFTWVKGHSVDKHNNDVDKAAYQKAQEYKNGTVRK